MLHIKKSVLVGLVIILIVAGLVFVFRKQLSKTKEYSVVYLTTGELYIGQLSTIPDLELKNIYLVQVAKDPVDPTKSSPQLQPISQTLWAPKVLHLEDKNVVFYGPLSPTSAIAQKLAEQK